MEIKTNVDYLNNEIYDIARLFFANLDEINLVVEENVELINNEISCSCNILFEQKKVSHELKNVLLFLNDLQLKKHVKRNAKLCVYQAFCELTNRTLPWGSLTGIRPTQLAYNLIEEGIDPYLIKENLMKNFAVSENKARLVEKIIRNQNCIIKNDNLVDLYINIPICPSRCSYCTFISAELKQVENIIPNYLDALIKEINAVKQIIQNKSFVVRTIYIGGGTPTSLTAEQLNMLLDNLQFPVSEFTVECGRPDTITESKLKVLKDHGVTRICINPQTFNNKTLKLIGRHHTAEDIIEAYKIALEYDFIINMDLIAGLPNEKYTNFKKSLDTVLELAPQNITVHTLSYKNGSILSQNEHINNENEIEKMVNYSQTKLLENGYKPYYLYRQKNQVDGLENVGYCLPNKICLFNVDSMEETCSILACGANAITKIVSHEKNRIDRIANVKFINDYLSRIDEMIAKKYSYFN